MACESNQGVRNPFLIDARFRVDLNLNLPLYSPLLFTGNSVYVGTNGVGTRGIFVTNVGNDLFRAYEASCPNHLPNDCSTMELDGQVVSCSCEDFEYFLLSGQQSSPPQDGTRYYDLLEYNARLNGGVVVVTN